MARTNRVEVEFRSEMQQLMAIRQNPHAMQDPHDAKSIKNDSRKN